MEEIVGQENPGVGGPERVNLLRLERRDLRTDQFGKHGNAVPIGLGET